MKVFAPKNILVAFDFTERSRAAWDYACAFSAKAGGDLHAVYVSDYLIARGAARPASDRRRQARLVQERLEKQLTGAASVRVAEGDAAIEILRAAARCRADLIVMAT